MTFDQILRVAEGLTLKEQSALIAHLQSRAYVAARTQILAEFERRKAAGTFEKAESLEGKFAHPALDLTFEEIQSITHGL